MKQVKKVIVEPVEEDEEEFAFKPIETPKEYEKTTKVEESESKDCPS